ncbi:MAG: hypothetical protein DUD39_18755 [Coriobacteriaceae bacterium]|nr:MAG: hypothetical protein DUD39_18755 [Coriobacteriaceae bacterium]
MARINLTLDQDVVLGLLTDGGGDAFRLLLQEMLNEVLRAESAEQLCAQPYEQTQECTDSRNETKVRPLTTRVATIELKVLRQRNTPFKDPRVRQLQAQARLPL